MRTPDSVAVAQSILAGKEPSDLYWNLKPNHKALDDAATRDTYLNPKRFLASPWAWHFLSTTPIPTIATEQAIDLIPAYRARLLDHAILDSLRMLNRIAEDTMKQPGLGACSLEKVTNNDRLRTRLAAAVHDELQALLADWDQLNQAGGETMITDTERKTLSAILGSEYHNGSKGAECINNPVWSDCLSVSSLSRHQVAGALSSLQAKGYVNTYGPAGDPTVEITQAGYEMLQEVAQP